MKVKTPTKVVELARYAAAQQEFVELAKSYPDVLAVYSAGTINHPGISDLDLVLVLKDKLTGPLDIEQKLAPVVAGLIGNGSIIKVNESAVNKIAMIDDFPLRNLFGRQYKFEQFDDINFKICRVLDWLPERIFTINKFSWRSAADILHGLRLLKSLTVSLKILQAVLGQASYDDFIKTVMDLRDSWITTPDEKSFARLFDQGRLVALKALNDINSWLTANEYLVTLPADQIAIFSIPAGPNFKFGDIATIGKGGLVVPWNMAAFLAVQAQSDAGFISSSVANCFNETPASLSFVIKDDLRLVIKRRIQYVNLLAQFFIDNNLTQGLLKYGWFLKQ